MKLPFLEARVLDEIRFDQAVIERIVLVINN